MTSTRKGGGLEICYVFVDSVACKQFIYCSLLRMDGVTKLVIFYGRDKCMTLRLISFSIKYIKRMPLFLFEMPRPHPPLI